MGTSCGGLEVFETSLLRGLHDESMRNGSDLEIVPILAYDQGRVLLPESMHAQCRMLWPRGKIGTVFNLGSCLRRCRPDLLHSFFVTPLMKTRVPLIVNIYDLGFARYPEHYPRALAWRLRKMLALTVRRADVIIALSEATRRDLLELTPVNPDKVHTVLGALDMRRFCPTCATDNSAILKPHGIRQPFLLYAGRLQPRKNIDTLVEAYDILRHSGRFDGQLVLLGEQRAFLWERPQARIDESPYRRDIIQTGHVADDHVQSFYRAAHAFVFISLYEGFGFPLVEAMACGVPIVCSNTTCLPEVAGDAAMLVDPLDAEAVADQLERVISDDALRADLVQKGFRRVREFSWEKTAREMRAIYESLV
jgi:glycosyltransferase involved in cell wall biosynthesis